jgi:hypothetical protein
MRKRASVYLLRIRCGKGDHVISLRLGRVLGGELSEGPSPRRN